MTDSCQCDVVPDRPCPAAITQEDLLCDNCRAARQPGFTHVSSTLYGPTLTVTSHGALDMRDFSFSREGS